MTCAHAFKKPPIVAPYSFVEAVKLSGDFWRERTPVSGLETITQDHREFWRMCGMERGNVPRVEEA